MLSNEELGRFVRHTNRWTELVSEGVLPAAIVVEAVEKLINDIEVTKKVLPPDDTVFELTHYFSPLDSPETMVARHRKPGFSSRENVTFTGNRLNGATRTGRFVLSTTTADEGFVLDAGIRVSREKGRVTDGQWLEAMRAQFKLPAEDTAVAVADPTWVVPTPHFPFIWSRSHMGLMDAQEKGLRKGDYKNDPPRLAFCKRYRWLIEV